MYGDHGRGSTRTHARAEYLKLLRLDMPEKSRLPNCVHDIGTLFAGRTFEQAQNRLGAKVDGCVLMQRCAGKNRICHLD